MGIAQVLRPLGLTFSILGAVQGILWTIISVLGILVYAGIIYSEEGKTVASKVLKDVADYMKDREDFLAFLIIYLLLSVYWMVVSMYQCWLLQKKKIKGLKNVLIQWTSLTAVISIVDLSLAILVAVEFSDLNSTPGHIYTLGGSVIILAVATRGIVLWIINVASVVVSVLFILHLNREEIRLSRYNDHVKPIQAFDHLQARPSSWFAEAVNDDDPAPRMAHVNSAFVDDDGTYNNNSQYANLNNPGTYDDDSIERYIDDEFRYINQSNYSNQDAWNQRFDTASRSSLVERPREKEPMKILNMVLCPVEDLEPPTIPPPDYTPPSSPVVRARPVLKSNPIYN